MLSVCPVARELTSLLRRLHQAFMLRWKQHSPRQALRHAVLQHKGSIRSSSRSMLSQLFTQCSKQAQQEQQVSSATEHENTTCMHGYPCTWRLTESLTVLGPWSLLQTFCTDSIWLHSSQ